MRSIFARNSAKNHRILWLLCHLEQLSKLTLGTKAGRSAVAWHGGILLPAPANPLQPIQRSGGWKNPLRLCWKWVVLAHSRFFKHPPLPSHVHTHTRVCAGSWGLHSLKRGGDPRQSFSQRPPQPYTCKHIISSDLLEIAHSLSAVILGSCFHVCIISRCQKLLFYHR